MFLSELQIINFRNLKFLRAEFGTGINLLHGANAQGKTNLLEAVYLLVTGRSFRTTTEREMIPWMREEYEASLVRARVHKRDGDDRMLLTFNQAGKHVFVNGVALARLGELLGRLNCVLFTPPELALVSGPPGGRRRFLDIELSQVSHPYLHHLQRYDLALRQSNALLKQHQHRPSLRQELKAWHAQLAEHGAALSSGRRGALARLAELASAAYATIAGEGENLTLEYQPSPAALAQCDTTDAAGLLSAALERACDDDVRRGAISAGPHRDDFAFHINGRDARDYGSQGQQRSCVLALKMAEVGLMEESTGETPILLLDDLMSELDESRRAALLGSIAPGIQTFITTTDKGSVTSLVPADRCFVVDDGELREEGNP